MLTFQVEGVVLDQNNTLLRLMLDHSEERPQHVQIRILAYQQQIQAAHDKKVKPRESKVRNLVMKHVIQGTRQKNHGKLGPNWEGPYIVIVRRGNGSHTLADQGKNQLISNGTLSN